MMTAPVIRLPHSDESAPSLAPYYPTKALCRLAPEFPAKETFEAMQAAGLTVIPTGKGGSDMKKPAYAAGAGYRSILNQEPEPGGGQGLMALALDFDVDEQELKLGSLLRLCAVAEAKGIKSLGRVPIQVSPSGGLSLLYLPDPLSRIKTKDKTFPCIDIRSGDPKESDSGDYCGYISTAGMTLRGAEMAYAKSKQGRPKNKSDPQFMVRGLRWPHFQTAPLASFADPRAHILAKVREADPNASIPAQLDEALTLAELGEDVPLIQMPEPLVALIAERQAHLANGGNASTWPGTKTRAAERSAALDDEFMAELTKDEMLEHLHELKTLAPEWFTDMGKFVELSAHIAAWNNRREGREVFDEVVAIGGELKPESADYWLSEANKEWRSAVRKGLPLSSRGNPQGSIGLVNALKRAKGEPVEGGFHHELAALGSRFIVTVGEKSVSVFDQKLNRNWQPSQLHLVGGDGNKAHPFKALSHFARDRNGNPSLRMAIELFIRKSPQYRGVRHEIEGINVRHGVSDGRPVREDGYYYRESSLLNPSIELVRDDAVAKEFLLRVAFIAGGNYVLFRWLTHWMANRYQRPMEPASTFPVLSSLYGGGGRSWLIEFVNRALMRPEFATEVKQEWLTQWTAELAGAVIGFMNEFDQFDNQEQLAAIIADLVTSRSKRMTQKNEKASDDTALFIGLMIASNRQLGFFQKKGQRRAVAIHSCDWRTIDATLGHGAHIDFFDRSYQMIGLGENSTAEENEREGQRGKSAIAHLMASINPYRTTGRVFGPTQAISEDQTDDFLDPSRSFLFYFFENLMPDMDEWEPTMKEFTIQGGNFYAAYGQWMRDVRKMNARTINQVQQNLYGHVAMHTSFDGRPLCKVVVTTKRKTVTLDIQAIRDHLAFKGAIDVEPEPDGDQPEEEIKQHGQWGAYSDCVACVERFWAEDYLPGLTARPRRNEKFIWVEDGYRLETREKLEPTAGEEGAP